MGPAEYLLLALLALGLVVGLIARFIAVNVAPAISAANAGYRARRSRHRNTAQRI